MGRSVPQIFGETLLLLQGRCRVHFSRWTNAVHAAKGTRLAPRVPQVNGLFGEFTLLVHDFIQKNQELSKNTKSAKRRFHVKNSKMLETAKCTKNFLQNNIRRLVRQRKPVPSDLRKRFWNAMKQFKKFKKFEQEKKDTKKTRYFEKRFQKDFWDFAKKCSHGTLESPPIEPNFSRDEANKYYKEKYSVSRNAFTHDFLEIIEEHDRPDEEKSSEFKFPFDRSPITSDELFSYIKNKPGSKAPGPDGVPLWFFKFFPELLDPLSVLCNYSLEYGEAPSEWANCNFKLLFKKNDPSLPKNFRMIALSPCAGKMFHGVMANRVLKYLSKNQILNSDIQKSFTPGVSGCIDHSWAVTELIQRARSDRRTLHLTFLDFSDAFGSVCHNFLETLLNKYGLPPEISVYIKNLYSKLSGKAICSKWETEEFRLRTGVFKETLFLLLFL